MPKEKRTEPLGDSEHGPYRGAPKVENTPAITPSYEAFASLGPLDPAKAHDWAVNFESRTLYRDDFRWLADSYVDAVSRLAASESRAAAAEAERDRLQEREAYFAKALKVPDAGQYRADWPAAMDRVIAESAALREWVAELNRALAEFAKYAAERRRPHATMVREALALITRALASGSAERPPEAWRCLTCGFVLAHSIHRDKQHPRYHAPAGSAERDERETGKEGA